MSSAKKHKAKLKIRNQMGFHVRPVQRFAELARVFKSDIQVSLRGRTVPGKSPMNLMSLGGRCGDTLEIEAVGEDSRQCVEVLRFLSENHFFVEDEDEADHDPERHLCRLHHIASAFDSDVRLLVDGRDGDAKDKEQLRALALSPTSAPEFEIRGSDAEQARAIFENLVEHCFYVEEEMVKRGGGAS